jgi:hypothetical protein
MSGQKDKKINSAILHFLLYFLKICNNDKGEVTAQRELTVVTPNTSWWKVVG